MATVMNKDWASVIYKDWSGIIYAAQENFPIIHEEIINSIGYMPLDVSIYKCYSYFKKFCEITGYDNTSGDLDYHAIIDWALEMKKNNEMIEYVWLL
jgi:hypothetical protein